MLGGCRESDPNRVVRFVKGIWGVTTVYSGPRVVPGYRLPSRKGHSVKQSPAEAATCHSPLHQQHRGLRTVGRHQPNRCPNPLPEQPSRPHPATPPTASYIATLARSGTRPPGGSRSDLLWYVAHPGGGGGGLQRDTTTKEGLLRDPGRDLTWHGWGRIWLGGGVGMSRSRPLSRLTGWYGWDGRYRTGGASPPISPAASPDPNYATVGTKAPAATCASTSTGPVDSTKTSKPEPKVVAAPPNRHRHQPQTQLPDPGGRFL